MVTCRVEPAGVGSITYSVSMTSKYTLTWTGADALEVEIRQVTEVYRSLRFYDGVRITYRVTPDVIQSIKEIESHIGQGNQRLRPADEKVADKIDEDDRRYLSRCRDWIR